MTLEENPEGIVKRFGYKLYIGRSHGTMYRVWSLVTFNLRERIWSQRSTIIAFIILLFIAVLILIPLALFAQFFSSPSPELADQIPPITLRTIFNPVTTLILINPFSFILLGVMGGRIFAEDLEHGTLDSYTVRLSRTHYYLGKFIALWISYFGTMAIPTAFLYWFVTTQFKFSLTNIDNLAVLVQALIYCFIGSSMITSVMLVISSSTNKPNYAVLMFIVGLYGFSSIVPIFDNLLGLNFPLTIPFIDVELINLSLYYLSVTDILTSLFYGIIGGNTELPFPGAGNVDVELSLLEALLMAVVTTVAGALYSFKRITEVE